MRVLCNGKTLAFQANDRGSIPLTRSITTSNDERLQQMSAYVQEAIRVSGINRTDLVAACAFLIRTKQATGQHDAIQQIASGKYNAGELHEQMIQSFQVELEQEIIEED